MRRFLFLFGLSAPVLSCAAAAASPIGEVVCASSAQMTQRLTRQMGVRKRATGLRSPEEIMEAWTRPNGDWTMVISYASGTSCIVAMGEHWADLPAPDPA